MDAAGDVKEAGRAGTEGGVVVVVTAAVEGPVVADVEVGAVGAPAADEEVPAARAGDVDAAAAAIVPLRSQGFGGEPIVQIGGWECAAKRRCS